MHTRATHSSEYAGELPTVAPHVPLLPQQPSDQTPPSGNSYQSQENPYSLDKTEDPRGGTLPLVQENECTPRPSSASTRAMSSSHDLPDEQRGLGYKTKAMLWTALSTIKMPLLYHLCSRMFGWSALDQRTNIDVRTLKKDGWTTNLPKLIHVLASLPALALVLLNCSSLYLGEEMTGEEDRDSEKLFGLLFAAKIHELLMLASLGAILGTHIRLELDRDGSTGVPFGALFAPFQFQNISFLLSSEMAGVLFCDRKKIRRIRLLIGLIFSCCVLGVLIGPSSATLMRPRLDIWAAGGTTFWVNVPEEELYPTAMTDSPALSGCMVDSGDLSCPAGNWQILSQAYLSYWPHFRPFGSTPGYMTVSSPYSGRDFRVKSRGSDLDGVGPVVWSTTYTIASVPLSPLADAVAELGRLWLAATGDISDIYRHRQEAFFKLEARQPVVFARCYRDSGFPIFDGTTIHALSPTHAAVPDYSTGHASTPVITWVDDPTLMEKLETSIAAIVTVPGENNSSPSSVHYCSIRAAFRSSTYEAKWLRHKVVAAWPSRLEDRDDDGIFGPDYQAITIEEQWARYLNPSIPGTNTTALAAMMKSAGVWNTSTVTHPGLHEIIVENTLAMLVANGISRANYNAGLPLDLLKGTEESGGEWVREMVSWGSRKFRGNTTIIGNAFNAPPDPDGYTKLEFQTTIHGYSYNWAGTAQLLAMTVLLLYTALAFLHICHPLWGRSWAGWNSLPEAATVIIQSLPAETRQGVVGPVEAPGEWPIEGYKTTVKSLKSP